MALDKNGNVYIADTGDNSIRIVTTDGIINSFAGDSYPNFAGDTAAAVDAELHSPSGRGGGLVGQRLHRRHRQRRHP